jgi:hypothetical protein
MSPFGLNIDNLKTESESLFQNAQEGKRPGQVVYPLSMPAFELPTA